MLSSMSNVMFTRKVRPFVCAVLLFALFYLMLTKFDNVTPFPHISQDAACKKVDMPFSSTRKDVINNSGANVFLQKYDFIFNTKKEKPSIPPDPNNPETMTTWYQASAMIDWYIRGPLRYQCKNVTAKGNWHICQDERFAVKPPCLVYSFGINWDFSFDDAMAKMGCEVHSFDPSMNEKDHERGNQSTFHNMGLSNINTDAYVARKDMYVKDRQVWKMRTLKNIMKELGHQNRVLDVFKMDIESYEWGVLDNLMESGVINNIRQFLLEFHLFPNFPLKEEYIFLYKTYTRFREMGFQEFALNAHVGVMNADTFNIQGDVECVNAFFQS